MAPSQTLGSEKEFFELCKKFEISFPSSSHSQSSTHAYPSAIIHVGNEYDEGKNETQYIDVPQSISPEDYSDNFRKLYSKFNIPGNFELLDAQMIILGKNRVEILEQRIQALLVDKPKSGLSFLDEDDCETQAPKNIREIVSQKAIDFFSSNPSALEYSGEIHTGKGKLYTFNVNKFQFTDSDNINQAKVKKLTKKIERIKCRSPERKSTYTGNHMGSIMYYKNLIICEYEWFVSSLISSNQQNLHPGLLSQNDPTILWPHNVNVLDIGTATGFNSLFVPEKGGFLVANDMFLKPLLEFRTRLTQSERTHTFFNVSSFPDQMIQPDNMFKAVLCSHVLHYCDGPQIRRGFNSVMHWLQEGTMFYIQALSIYSNPFRWWAPTLQESYLVSQENPTIEWPGCINRNRKTDFDGEEPLYDEFFYPNLMHALHPSILERELKKAGFEIEYINFGPFIMPTRLPVSWKEQEYYITGNWLSSATKPDPRIADFEQVMIKNGLEFYLEHMRKERAAYVEAKKTKSPSNIQLLENVMVIARKPICTISTSSTQQQ